MYSISSNWNRPNYCVYVPKKDTKEIKTVIVSESDYINPGIPEKFFYKVEDAKEFLNS